MNILSDRINQLSESETLAMTRLSRELKAQGHDVINLSIGEPDFDTPEYIKQAARDAIDQNYTHYPPVSGYQELREAISLKLKRDNGLNYKPNQVVVSAGAKHSIANAMLCLVNPGDEVLLPAPYWVSYREIIKLAEGKAVIIDAPIEQDYKITPGQLEKAITSKAKAMIFSSPCNPTGSVYSREELEALARVLAKHPRIFIIADEIYEHINFVGHHESIGQFDFLDDRVITVNGVSKGFAMTGWRIGYLAAPEVIAKACDKIQGQFTSGVCTIAQKAAIKALTMVPENSEDLKKMLSAFRERRDIVVDMMNEIPGFRTNVPQGAFYVFPNVEELYGRRNGDKVIQNGEYLCDYILKKVFVALVPGSAFGSPKCIRLSYATSKEHLVDAIGRIKKAVSELN